MIIIIIISEKASWKPLTYIKQMEGIHELVVDPYWFVTGVVVGGDPKKCQVMKKDQGLVR